MGCKDCKEKQSSGWGTFVRVGTANIFVSGCDKHLQEMFSELKRGATDGL